MRDILSRLDQLNEGSMDKASHNPTGPKFGGYWKGTQKSPPKPGQGVGGGCEESILKDLDKASKENPRTDTYRLMSEWEAFKESADEFVLYINGKPAAKYSNLGQAEQDVIVVKQRVPSAKCEIKQEVCKMTHVASKVTESFIKSLVEGDVLPFPKREVKPQDKKPQPKKNNVKAISKDRYAKVAPNTMQGPNMASIYEEFKSKQEVIAYFVKQGKTAAQGASAWERGWRGPKPKARPTKAPQAGQKYWWQDKEEQLDEYGGTGGYGAASMAPQGSSNQTPDPEAQQQKMDQTQIQKNTNQIAQPLNQQGAAQSLNKVKFSDVMTKLDATPNTDLSSQDLKQMEPMAVATSKALQNPQTANQMKQLINKADTLDKQKQQKVKQAQQQAGTNQPADDQQPQSTNAPQKSAGQPT